MELIDCPHCGGVVNATFTLCPRCGKELRKSSMSKLGDANGGELSRRQSERENKAQNLGCLVLIALVVIAVIVGFVSIYNSGKVQIDEFNASASAEAAADDLKFSGNCPGLTYAVDETTATLAGLGDTSTSDDAISILKKNGELFQGYAALVQDVDQASVVRDAGSEMLQLRVALIGGSETQKIAMWLKSDFQTISSVCNG